MLRYFRDRSNILLVCFFFIFLYTGISRNKNSLEGVIWSDVEGYYMDLPAVLIYHDVHHIPERSMNGRKNEKGETIIKYTCGTAFFYLPFFLGAHIYAHIFHYDTSGFSTPYYYGMILCGVFWAFMGLYWLKTLLLKYFKWGTTLATVLCIMLGTNFFHYATKYVGMSHVYSFALFAAILLLTDNYYKKPESPKAMLLGLLLGWIVLIRPTNCIMALIVLLYNVRGLNDLKQRLLFLKTRIPDMLWAVPFFIIALAPQLLYWKEITGKWVTYSYEGEGFIFWKQPKIAAVLFDTQNGLFLYSPILLFMFVGLVAGRKDTRANFMGISIVFVIITYVFASWWAWWFGAAFGHRCYIEYFPIFAFPLAISMERIIAMKNGFIKSSIVCIILLFIFYSVRMSMLFDRTGIWDGPSWRWNWHAWADQVRHIF